MPPIRQTLSVHPQTGKRGIWIDTTIPGLGLIGLAESAYPLRNLTGNQTADLQAVGAAISAAINNLLVKKIPLAQVDQSLQNQPEPHCRIETGFYVAQLFTVQVTVLSLSPLQLGDITFFDAAAGSVQVTS